MGISLLADTLRSWRLVPFVQTRRRHRRGPARGHRLGERGRPDARDETQSWADARCPPAVTMMMSAVARNQAVPRPYRVVVADPHAAAREAIGMVLFGDSSFQLTGSAATMEDAIRLIRETDPDVLVVDPWLFGPAGMPGCLAAKQINPRLVIIMLLPGRQGDYPQAASAMGADATVEKQRVGRDLIGTVLSALDQRG